MTFLEQAGILILTNLITLGFAVWNFRIRLERRLTIVEVNIETIKKHLGV
jgi:hypothetical protein